jgi:Zn-dependent peptidase ImmA (M78 family)/transcriptional regulator with XRE-family HTH domain
MKGTLGFVGKRLTEARQSRGLNKTTLAKLIGVVDSQVTKYESGDQSPSMSILDKISSVLRMPIDYFFYERAYDFDVESPVYYRSMSNATQQQRKAAESRYVWLHDIFCHLWKFIDFPPANLPDIEVPNNPEEISRQFIEQAADDLRRCWGISDEPIDNITRLVENNGIVVSFHDLGADSLDGFSHRNFDRPHIVISTRKASAVRIRFSLCHELGHLLLHRNIPKEMLNDAYKFKLIEKQAHQFASAFIFPQSAFYQEILVPDLTTFRIRKARWKLSISSMIARAKELKIINEDAEKLLRRSYGAKRWNRVEPLDDDIAIDYPELLKDAFELVLSERIQSKSSLLDAIPLLREDIEEIAGLESGFLQDNIVKLQLRREKLSSPEFSTPKKDSSGSNVVTLIRPTDA